MPATPNIFDTHVLIAVAEEIVPRRSFFRDRYFPTEAGDIFAADKVVTEYRKGDRKMAAFVSKRVGDIPVDREGYAIHEYKPAFIAPSRLLTLDELRKRQFGEALYVNSTPAQRAARLVQQDLIDLDRRISAREEWMAAKTMIDNACTMQTYIDATTQGETLHVKFFDTPTSEHIYSVSPKWDATGGDIRGDVIAMVRMLTRRGLPATDLVLGADAADVLLLDDALRKMLETTSNIALGRINETATEYDGVTLMGVLNFGGRNLNVWRVDEDVEDLNGSTVNLFPATSAMVTAPGCGHLMYGQITQIDFNAADYSTYAATRVPKLVVDQANDTRKLRLAARPLAAPKNYCPFIYAANVCG